MLGFPYRKPAAAADSEEDDDDDEDALVIFITSCPYILSGNWDIDYFIVCWRKG